MTKRVEVEDITTSVKLKKMRLCSYKGCKLGGRIKIGHTAYIVREKTGKKTKAYHVQCHGKAFPVTKKYSGRTDGGSGVKYQGTGNRRTCFGAANG